MDCVSVGFRVCIRIRIREFRVNVRASLLTSTMPLKTQRANYLYEMVTCHSITSVSCLKSVIVNDADRSDKMLKRCKDDKEPMP
jgi:hypothetical protein